VGCSWEKLVLREDLERLMGYHEQRSIDPEAGPRNYELKVVCKSGEIRDISATVTRMPESRKAVASYLDITPSRKREPVGIAAFLSIKRDRSDLFHHSSEREESLSSLKG